MAQKYIRKFILSALLAGFAFFSSEVVAVPVKQNASYLRSDTIAGKVVDDYGKGIKGVSVRIDGKGQTVTNSIGEFSLNGSLNDILVLQHPSFYRTKLTVKNTRLLKIKLAPRYAVQDDSVNVLYYKKPKAAILGAVSTIGSNELISSPVSSTLIAMAGRVPGLNILQSSGFPTRDGDGLALPSNLSASIRGFNASTTSGRELILLIDGAPRPFTSIDPEEIESVSVLKDALSTVMYGQRSTPGIVSITTKRGVKGAPRLSFTAQTGIQSPLAFPETLSAFDYATLYNKTQLYADPSATPKFTQAALDAYSSGSDSYLYPNVDWKNTALRNQTNIGRYNFNVQGAGSNVHYFVALDYLREQGLFKTADFNNYNTNSDNNRYIARSNVGVDLNKTLKLDLGVFARIQDGTQPGNNDAQGILNAILTTPSLAYPVYNPNGTYGGNSTYGSNIWGRTVQSGYSITNTRDLSFDLALTQRLDDLVKGLWIKGSGNVNLSTSFLTNRLRSYAISPLTGFTNGNYTYGTNIGTNSDIPLPVSGTATGSAQYRQTYSYLEGLAGYDRAFGPHSVSSRLVTNVQSVIRNQDIPVIYTNYAANVSYDFSKKYFMEVAGSYGGFNQFAPGKKYEPFYAFGLGWNIANENIIKENVSWINNLKLRATYGKTGYVNRGTYGYFEYMYRYSNTGTYYYYGNTASSFQGYNEAGLANQNLEGEKAHKLNAGADIGLFQNKLTFSADYFKNDVYDVMITRGNPLQIVGSSYPAENIGKQRYSGYELVATYNDHLKNFNYFISGNASVVKTKVVNINEIVPPNQYQQRTGYPIGANYGLTAIGLFRSQSEIDQAATPDDVNKTDIKPGDIKYLDRNNDKKINLLDESVIGNTKPMLVYGITVGGNFKGIDFSALVQGVKNRDVYTSGDYEWAFRNNGVGNAFKHSLNAYSPENPESNYPRLSIGSNINNEKTSTFWLHDGSFVRLKNVELGYTLPARITQIINVPSLRVFMSGENLLTYSPLFDYRKDLDPEVFGSSYPMQRVINFGLNIKL